ncbi:MAG: hypothetical protein DCF22_00540 [Leptolyngbya sp.]|nr:MAG: hypothetical protein DCF22_00540 [Leptolyngbya sp.]
MRIELDDGENLEIATSHGTILISPQADTGTLVGAIASEGNKLATKMDKTPKGNPIANVWIQPQPVSSQNL